MDIDLKKVKEAFQDDSSPLIHCISNDITTELLANVILFLGAKPFMAYAKEEMEEISHSCKVLFLNTGQLNPLRAQGMIKATEYYSKEKKKIVLDCVGIGASSFRRETIEQILKLGPDLIKGNYSEMRALCQLKTEAKGVDVSEKDESREKQIELLHALEKRAKKTGKVYLATGKVDLLTGQGQSILLKNGSSRLDWLTGTGDIVGVIASILLGRGLDPISSAIGGVSALNISAERAQGMIYRGAVRESSDKEEKITGALLPLFRLHLLNELSKLRKDPDWTEKIQIEKL